MRAAMLGLTCGLTPAVSALCNRFDPSARLLCVLCADPAQRITLPQIIHHPWCASATDIIANNEEMLQRQVETGVHEEVRQIARGGRKACMRAVCDGLITLWGDGCMAGICGCFRCADSNLPPVDADHTVQAAVGGAAAERKSAGGTANA